MSTGTEAQYHYMLDPQTSPHTSPWRVSYGVSFVNICGKNWPRYNGTALHVVLCDIVQVSTVPGM